MSAPGMWLMATLDVLDSTGTAADSHHLVGALIMTFAVTAMAGVTRAAHFVTWRRVRGLCRLPGC